ncbi:hypothetical protein [Longispora albida]|uniref:hypothetical protein n=1 Tax=Longispora albida TaxID=203523 RepID=UPI0012FC929A|nr:hypothetical protein [Longispora albida]
MIQNLTDHATPPIHTQIKNQSSIFVPAAGPAVTCPAPRNPRSAILLAGSGKVSAGGAQQIASRMRYATVLAGEHGPR